MKTQTPALVVETERTMYLLASDAKTNSCTGAYLSSPSSPATSNERPCTCGSGEPWVSCSANSHYCG